MRKSLVVCETTRLDMATIQKKKGWVNPSFFLDTELAHHDSAPTNPQNHERLDKSSSTLMVLTAKKADYFIEMR